MRAPAFPHTARTLRDAAHSYWLTLPLRVDAACAAHADCQVYPLALQFVQGRKRQLTFFSCTHIILVFRDQQEGRNGNYHPERDGRCH